MHEPGLALLLATDVAEGRVGTQAAHWLAAGLRAWLRADGQVSLERCLQLPRRPDAARRALRDFWLRAASAHLGEGLPLHHRARRLLGAALRLQAGLSSGEPASVDEALAKAMSAGVALPATAQGLAKLVR
jgi:hypothetical protein